MQLLADPLGFFFGFGIIGMILNVVLLIFWLWMLVDVITNQRIRDTEKIIWVLVVLLLPLLGAILYYFIGRKGGGTTAGV